VSFAGRKDLVHYDYGHLTVFGARWVVLRALDAILLSQTLL
jgi:hypothetical protein